jgi:hypothetical protein
MTYQNVQKNMLYILVSNSCIVKQLEPYPKVEELIKPLYSDLGFVGVQTLEHLNFSQFDPCILGFILCIINMSYHHA